MALEGSFSDFGLAEIFQLISLQKKTGVLTVRGGQEGQVVTVSFDKGMVAFADEYQRSEEERLGNILLRSKLVTKEALGKAMETQKQTLQRLGHVLVQMGFITQQELRRSLQSQMKETVYRLFRWKEGSYHFSPEPVSFDKDMYQPMASEFLLMEGVRMIDEWPIIEKKISSFDMVFEKVPGREPEKQSARGGDGGGEDWDDIMSIVDEGPGEAEGKSRSGASGLSPQEQAIYQIVDGARTVQEIIDIGKIGEFEACKVLYGFLSVGLIRQVDEAAAVSPTRSRKPTGLLHLGDVALVAITIAVAVAALLFNPWSYFSLNYNVQQSREEVGMLVDDLKIRRLHHALGVFYLEKQAYPFTLEKLAEERLLRSEAIRNHRGRVFTYRSDEKEFQFFRE
jgi:hypothetical protein